MSNYSVVVFLVTLTLVTVVNCAPAELSGTNRVINGIASKLGQHPWQISLRYRGSHSCGGSIIDQTTVLTAAHCIRRYSPTRDYSVAVGSIYRQVPTSQVYQVSKYIIHSSYRSVALGNDIAIVKLTKPITFSSYAKAIRLPSSSNDAPAVGSACHVSGWGSNGVSSPNTLQYTSILVASNTKCNEIYRKYLRSNIYSTQICAGGEARNNACFGDSGGPLSCKRGTMDVLDGIVSWGPNPCGQVGIPGAYTRVAKFLSWIQANR
ncbi:chymotrypsin-1-like [Tubulanus polymorphus]|uniref:chymotrypsin-1-like n=1 Tax=Tubulanus polymorphus TaxID=672921 RepID=UPI003DA60C6F